jgi:Uma2 family endonuclease
MSTQPLDRYTLEQYLAIEDQLDYRSEFHDGIILPVENTTPIHARLETRLGSILEQAFSACVVYGPGLNVYVAASNKILHPDATVICGPPNSPKPNCIDNPTLLVEITSPSTKDYDYGTKREHYFTLPSIQHYLLVSQTERKVGYFERSDQNFRKGWTYIDHGPDANIYLTVSGREFRLPVGEIYAGIVP